MTGYADAVQSGVYLIGVTPRTLDIPKIGSATFNIVDVSGGAFVPSSGNVVNLNQGEVTGTVTFDFAGSTLAADVALQAFGTNPTAPGTFTLTDAAVANGAVIGGDIALFDGTSVLDVTSTFENVRGGLWGVDASGTGPDEASIRVVAEGDDGRLFLTIHAD